MDWSTLIGPEAGLVRLLSSLDWSRASSPVWTGQALRVLDIGPLHMRDCEVCPHASTYLGGPRRSQRRDLQ